MQSRMLLVSVAGAIASLAMASWVVERTTENGHAMEAKRALVVAGRQPVEAPQPVPNARPTTPAAGLSALATKLRSSTLDDVDKAEVERKVGLAQDALSDDNGTRFDGFMIELAAMEQAIDVECTVRADLDGAGRPMVSIDAATGRVVLKGTCWAPGPGAMQRASRGAQVHATDLDVDAMVDDMAKARDLMAQAQARDFVYGSKSKGEYRVRWFSDAIRTAQDD